MACGGEQTYMRAYVRACMCTCGRAGGRGGCVQMAAVQFARGTCVRACARATEGLVHAS